MKKLEDKIREQPSLKYNEALDFFKKEYGVQIALRKIFRAMKEAKELTVVSSGSREGKF